MSEFSISIPLRLKEGSKSLDREAELPPNGDILTFGMHGAVAEHYKAAPPDPQPSTLDYLVASIGGCLIGTFAGSLMRARVPGVTPESLSATATGVVSSDDDDVLVLRRVRLDYVLAVDPEHHAAAEDVHAAHASRCPNARSVSPSIEIETRLDLKEAVAA